MASSSGAPLGEDAQATKDAEELLNAMDSYNPIVRRARPAAIAPALSLVTPCPADPGRGDTVLPGAIWLPVH